MAQGPDQWKKKMASQWLRARCCQGLMRALPPRAATCLRGNRWPLWALAPASVQCSLGHYGGPLSPSGTAVELGECAGCLWTFASAGD